MVREAAHKKKKMCSPASRGIFSFFRGTAAPPAPTGRATGGWRGVVNGSQCADLAWPWVVGGGWLSPLARPLNSALRPCCPPISALTTPTEPPIDEKRAIQGGLWAVLAPRPPITALHPFSPVLRPLQRSIWASSVCGSISALTAPRPPPSSSHNFSAKRHRRRASPQV